MSFSRGMVVLQHNPYDINGATLYVLFQFHKGPSPNSLRSFVTFVFLFGHVVPMFSFQIATELSDCLFGHALPDSKPIMSCILEVELVSLFLTHELHTEPRHHVVWNLRVLITVNDNL